MNPRTVSLASLSAPRALVLARGARFGPSRASSTFLTAGVLLLAACSPAPEMSATCTPEMCGGCCDANGVCQPGDAMDACGGGGLACDVCVANQVCGAGKCGDGSGVGGGTGGGSGGGAGGGGGGGGMCTPTTCAAQNKNCGDIPDGCGGTLTCGTCGGVQTCGGAGMANVCGAMCQMSCPAGFSCNAQGACAGGNVTMLSLDVKTVKVSGTVTLNGAALANVGTSCASYPTDPKVTLHFADVQRGYFVSAEILCGNAANTFSADLFPGTYQVSVEGHDNSTALPTTRGVVVQALPVTAAIANQVIDVKLVPVSGTVTLNGAVPSNMNTAGCPASLTKAYVVFREQATYAEVRVPVPCGGATFAYSGMVFPGTYSVRIDGSDYYSALPSQPVQVAEGLAISAALNKSFDVKTFSLAGKLTVNGAAPVNNPNEYCYSYESRATVQLVDAIGNVYAMSILCPTTDYGFSGTLPAGTYEVRVVGSKFANIPAAGFQAAPAFVLGAAVANQIFDVKTQAVTGNVTLNGMTPSDVGARCQNYPSERKARVVFVDKAKKYHLDIDVPCSSATYAFTGTLFPGSYEVRVEGSTSSNIPAAGFLAGNLNVAGAVPGQVFDVKTVAMSGVVLLNGMPPNDLGTECLSHPNDVKATVTFTDAAKGHVVTANIPCSSANYAFATALFPGTYDVRVKGTNRSDLPQSGFQVNAAKVVTGGQSGQMFDVKTTPVGGKVLLNGAAPANAGNQCFMYPNDVKAIVTFRDRAKGYELSTNVLCSSAEFAFAAPMFPGTYEVRVKGTDRANVPEAEFLAIGQLSVP